MAAPLAFPIASAIMGGVQLMGGLIGAASMGARPRYSMTPEMRRSAGRAEYMAGMGFLPEERAAAIQEGRNAQAGVLRRTMDAGGGNLARSIYGAQGADNLEFQNRLASQDANLRRGNIRYADTFSREAQRIQDMNTGADISARMAEEQQLGGAIRTGSENLVNSFNQNQYFNFMKDLYGGKAGGSDIGLGGIGGETKMGMKIPLNQTGSVSVMQPLQQAATMTPDMQGAYGGGYPGMGGFMGIRNSNIFSGIPNYLRQIGGF
jgi:hypothetical protein